MTKLLSVLLRSGLLIPLLFIACSGPEQTTAPNPDTAPVTASQSPTPSQPMAPPATGEPDATDPTVQTPAEDPASTATSVPATTSTVEPSLTPSPQPSPTQTAPSSGNSVLPGSRVLSYYGHPSTGAMGILGEYSKEDLLVVLQEQAAAYEAADPNTPVVLAFELIATVAQPVPGDDGTYLLYTGDEWIGEYVDFVTANDMLLILDLQLGHDTVENEINKIRHWLELPNVHVALDPEFSTEPDRIPGEFIGEIDGSEVNRAAEMLAEIVREKNLPSKILIVHQFEHEMISNKQLITPVEGVDIVIDMDGFGSPEAKLTNYDIFVRQELIEYGGIKMFYKQDDPVLTPEQIVSLDPPPLVVIYQ